MRFFFIFLGGFLLAAACQAQSSAHPFSFAKTNNEIPLVWGGDSLLGGWDPYAYLLVPVKLPGCPKQFYMQFDLGSPNSMFYQDKMKQIRQKYPKAVSMNDTAHQLRNVRFAAGKTTITVSEIMLKKMGNSSINWTKKNIHEVIGTIGSDLILNKVLIIDYPGKRLLISDTVPDRFAAEQFDQLIWAGRGVLLPATIKGKKTMLFFDSGSSSFELITDKETSLSMAEPGSVPVQYPVNSWGRILTANSYPSGDSIEFASKKVPLKHVTYMEGASDSQVNQMKNTGMGGMTGNKLFLNSMLILDIPGKRVALVNP